MNKTLTQKNYNPAIIVISLLVPVIVAALIFMPGKSDAAGDWVRMLPHINGVINSITSLLLVAALISVRRGSVRLHKTLMLTSFALGALFLISYIIYHASAPSTVYGDLNGNGTLDPAEAAAAGSMRAVYLAILLSHIVLAAIVAPLVLFSLFHGLRGAFDRHKKIVKFAFPVWLYVSVSGVIVYLMISPYY